MSWLWLGVALLCLPSPVRRTSPAVVARLPLLLDLVAAALRAGLSVPDALAVAAPAADAATSDALAQVCGLLRLGADANEAWRVVESASPLTGIAAVARRSSTSGIRLAGSFEQLAAELRRDAGVAAEARASRAGILVALPLAFCFLPAFVCLGIAPAVIGLASTALHATA